MKNRTKQLAKFLGYVLGRRPDEFGLVPDSGGFVKIKELLQALNEEEGWRHVKFALINELMITMAPRPVEINDNLIRAVDRGHLATAISTPNLPKLLFAAVTRKSHPVVLEKGIHPTRHAHVVLSRDESMALRMGKRRDPQPVILTVNVQQSANSGVIFKPAGDLLYTADKVPEGCFTGPPLPKEKPEKQKAREPADTGNRRLAGSYVMDLDAHGPTGKKGKPDSWKRDKKRIRREKQKKWPT